jgi:hypothetical protein
MSIPAPTQACHDDERTRATRRCGGEHSHFVRLWYRAHQIPQSHAIQTRRAAAACPETAATGRGWIEVRPPRGDRCAPSEGKFLVECARLPNYGTWGYALLLRSNIA